MLARCSPSRDPTLEKPQRGRSRDQGGIPGEISLQHPITLPVRDQVLACSQTRTGCSCPLGSAGILGKHGQGTNRQRWDELQSRDPAGNAPALLLPPCTGIRASLSGNPRGSDPQECPGLPQHPGFGGICSSLLTTRGVRAPLQKDPVPFPAIAPGSGRKITLKPRKSAN